MEPAGVAKAPLRTLASTGVKTGMTPEPVVPVALPYPLAQQLRAQGLNDDAVRAELERRGVPAADARFAVNSLPGNAYGLNPAHDARGSEGGGRQAAGLLLLGLGLLITLGSYAAAAPGESYVITWGLIVAGVARVLRA